MLYLTRSVGQSIMIGTIEVKILLVDRGKVRLGFIADRSIPIDRAETRLWKDEERKNQEAQP